eukprot:CAMPEP_0172712436 /NCGR_PEP_ID=MMETSP1074-20121228/61097_1 /TAXON_ID=2916 /ORGANISM="Ceratium fusus, Strain PA161109" /LENGTH=206 /DNA_ID=CAMNT_0013536363 /DNA_START=49 /DNA_END=669 /DNA_ORIENTATION=-
MAAMGTDMVEPKKPANAYWMWLGENRQKITSELGPCKGNLVSKAAGDKWRAMSDAEKVPWVKKAEINKNEYAKQLQEFIQNGGKKGQRRKEKVQAMENPKRARKEKNRNLKASGKPSRPQNAYWLWLSENRPKLMAEVGSGKVGKVGKLAGERWKMISAADKVPYEKEAEKRKQKYAEELEQWKATQAELGENDEDDDEGEEEEEA